MKKLTLILTGMMMCFVMAHAQQNEKKVVAIQQPVTETQLIWTTTETIDLGKIEKGKPVTATFEFKNAGDTPVIISSAKGQCGCTAVEYSKQVVTTSQKGFVKATYNAANTGVFDKTIFVAANTTNQQIQLHIKGEVY